MVTPADTERLQTTGQPGAHLVYLRCGKSFAFECKRAGVTQSFQASIAKFYQVHRDLVLAIGRFEGFLLDHPILSLYIAVSIIDRIGVDPDCH
jgi:fructose-specific phosphotransferase system IIC component